MNWGTRLAIGQIILCAGSSLGYLAAGEYRKAAYFFLASLITAVISL